MKEKIKKFKKVGDSLHVTVTDGNDVIIPIDGKREKVGVFTQETIQMIDGDKISVLKSFIQAEEIKAIKQLDTLKAQHEPLKDIESIDETIIKHCRQAIDKGTKSFKLSMQKLNKRISDLDQKKALEGQIEFMEKSLKEVKSDLMLLDKAIN